MRLFLTLLALLTGLAAQLSPAQARIRADDISQIGACAVTVLADRTASAQVSASAALRDRGKARLCRAVAILRSDAPPVTPVLAGIDRAHE